MAVLGDLPAAPVAQPPVVPVQDRSRILGLLADPVAIFLVLAVSFGLVALLVNPPLRGPDEAAHFLRVYGLTTGDVIPAIRDERGRKGIFLPARLHDDFSFFEAARHQIGTPGFTYRNVIDGYPSARAGGTTERDGRPAVFVLYQGSESYLPVPYLPSVLAAAIGRALGLDFLGLLYLMRAGAFLATTAAAAYAIAIVPHLKCPFLLIAMLPSALYARTIVSADGAALSLTLVVVALCMRSACRPDDDRIWQRATFMALCVLSKPPQLALLVLPAMAHPLAELGRRWRELALITLPGLVLTMLWVVAGSADIAAWRVADDSNMSVDMFDPARKLAAMLANPLHFPNSLLASLTPPKLYDLWRQLIGELGWLDTDLQDWVYPVVSGLLAASFLAPMPIDRAVRYRIAAVSAMAAVGYALAVHLIFYLTWTPIDWLAVWGVQGRYFVIVLPLAACITAAILNAGPGATTRAAIAVCGAVLSGAATIEAILRVNW